MEPMFFGLPLTTIAVVAGLPIIIVALLVWWGVSYHVPADENTASAKRRKA